MFELKVTLISKSESLLGFLFDQGEFELVEDTWVPFTRLRIGIIFAIVDVTYYKRKF
jgi:hypothetical protein